MNLAEKIESQSAVVAVIGLGYVGLPLLAAFHRAGFPVIGLDNDPAKIDALHRGKNYLKHLGPNLVRDMLRAGRFEATSDPAHLANADAIISCVPTPLGKHLEPDLTFVRQTATDIAAILRKGQLIVLESSTYPGTTRDVMLPILAAGGLKCGRDFFLAYSPEREDPGRKDFSTQTIPKLVGGIDRASTAIATALYRKAVSTVIPVSTSEVAEAAKLLENIYRSVNIALVNEMKTVLAAMNIDIWEVIAAAATKPFGFQPFYPGPGLGGHCIPIDPFYLAWKAREAGQTTRFIELAGEINRAMPEYVVSRLGLALNDRGKTFKQSKILILGLAYKPDVDDVRESPSIELIARLRELGAHVDYNDPHVPATHKMRRHHLQMKSVPLTPRRLASYDCVLIATHHSAYNWRMIARHAKLIVDTRGVMRNVKTKSAKVVQA
ncbi:MAG: nucleotide sugar dehydrogenase [Tepidisphaeraceae bacterium]|jgi:UDP-N-acetyl-D-glucosamine dehydrogenase